jgi:hypothetical protein
MYWGCLPRRLIVFHRLSVSTSFVLAALRALHMDASGAAGRDRPVSRKGGVWSAKVGCQPLGVGQRERAEGLLPAVHDGAFDQPAGGLALLARGAGRHRGRRCWPEESSCASAPPPSRSKPAACCSTTDPGRRRQGDRAATARRPRHPASRDDGGFIPVDPHGVVRGAADVFAASDATDYPLKQGGLASQQADAVAEAIAARLGAAVVPEPFRPCCAPG